MYAIIRDGMHGDRDYSCLTVDIPVRYFADEDPVAEGLLHALSLAGSPVAIVCLKSVTWTSATSPAISTESSGRKYGRRVCNWSVRGC